MQTEKSGTISCSNDQYIVTCAFSAGQSSTAGSIGYQEEVSPTLRAASSGSNQAPTVAYCLQGNTIDRHAAQNGTGILEGVSYTLNTVDRHAVVTPPGVARKLTPLECERLQGYPDGWTDIPDYIDSKGRTRKATDTARYKALGNSIALPCAEYVLQGIVDRLLPGATLGSLFDGIGGFPLVWETISGAGTARWASEIDDFPAAVTAYRFEEEETNGQPNQTRPAGRPRGTEGVHQAGDCTAVPVLRGRSRAKTIEWQMGGVLQDALRGD